MDFSSVDPTLSAELINLGSSLASLVVKGTVTAVHGKIESLKNEKNIETIRSTYDDVVNQLISEREEAVRIAQAYKAELDRVVISDKDIEHLHNTISTVLDLIKTASPDTAIASFEWVKSLASADTLKTMQLLGFNYKAAIGEPLTKVCSDAILKLGQEAMSGNKQNNNIAETNKKQQNRKR